MTVQVQSSLRAASASILIIEDDPVVGEIVVGVLQREGHRATLLGSAHSAREQLLKKFDLCVIDLKLPDGCGVELLRWIKHRVPDLPCVMISATATSDAAVSALKSGAIDYLAKPLLPSLLLGKVTQALRMAGDPGSVGRIQWRSPQMQEVQRRVEDAARATCPVLISGPLGSGRSRIAGWIHRRSARGQRKLQILNLDDVDAERVTSQLFGDVLAGDLDVRSRGLVDRATGSTLILKALERLPPSAQSALMDHVAKQRYRSDTSTITRLISITGHSFEQFSQDESNVALLQNLSPVHICLPALDLIPEDLEQWGRLLLAELGLGKRRGSLELTSGAWEELRGRSWPQNLLSLSRVLEGSFAMTSSVQIGAADLIADLAEPAMTLSGVPSIAGSTKIADLERISLEAALRACDGNRRCVAKRLGVSLRTVYNMIARHRSSDAGE